MAYPQIVADGDTCNTDTYQFLWALSMDACRNQIKQLVILPFISQYIFSVLLFVVKNRAHFTTNYDSHNIPTQQLKIFFFYLPPHPYTNKVFIIQV
jgi:hypothetical protein